MYYSIVIITYYVVRSLHKLLPIDINLIISPTLLYHILPEELDVIIVRAVAWSKAVPHQHAQSTQVERRSPPSPD